MVKRQHQSQITLAPLMLAVLAACQVPQAQAQTEAERQVIKRASASPDQAESLKKKLQTQHELNEEAVGKYLSANPDQQRSFTKDVQVYYLQSITDNGQPIYITTRGERVKKSSQFKSEPQAQLMKATALYPGGSLGTDITGTGMTAGIWDAGRTRVEHDLLAGQATMAAGQTSDGGNHMTHVTGIVVGKKFAAPNPHATAHGIAYQAQAIAYDWDDDLPEMLGFAGQGGLVSNHSYGPANTDTTPSQQWFYGAYDQAAANVDTVAQLNPFYLPFIAGGNEQQDNGNTKTTGGSLPGFDVMTSMAASKNVVTVGALEADGGMTSYSNFGPTDDNRLKPDVVAQGSTVESSVYFGSDNVTPSNNTYSIFAGTSMATPSVTGGALLLQQYYATRNASTYMRAATLKALLTGTATDLGNPGPDLKFGWGLVNLEAAGAAIKNRSGEGSPSSLDYTLRTSDGKGAYIEEIAANPAPGSEMRRVFTAAGDQPLVVTISWADDAGTVQTSAEGVDPVTSRVVYDFDLVATNLSDSTATGSWITPVMTAPNANATKASGLDDVNQHANTVRQVLVNNPVAGAQYEIRIRKKAGSPATARTVSLVVTGLRVGAAPNVSLSKAFASPSMVAGSTTALTLTIANTAANALALTQLAVTDNLPSGMMVASPANASSTCTNTSTPLVTAATGSTNIALSGGSVAANASCTVTVNVTAASAGTYSNTIAANALTSAQDATNAADATTSLTVNAITTVPGNGAGNGMTLAISNSSSSCTLASTQFTARANLSAAAQAALPAGYTYPYAAVDFVAEQCAPGSTLTVALTYPSPLPVGARLMKYDAQANQWAPFATVSGAQVSYTITDNDNLDADKTSGRFVDPMIAAIPEEVTVPNVVATPVPSLGTWGMALLTLLAGTAGFAGLRRKKTM